MAAINDVQKYIERRQMQQEEANAAIPPVGNAVPAVAENNVPPATPSSAIDTGAPVSPPAVVQQPAKVPSPVIPDLAVAPGGPTSPMNEKPAVTITDPTDTKLVGSSLPDITTESFEEAMKRGKYTPAQWLHENEKAAKEGKRDALTMEDYLKAIKYGDMNESPEQKAKRERREQVSQAISGIGNVIANAANLAFTAKGAVPIDLNSGVRYENERMQRIQEKRDALKEKTDALFLDGKMDGIKNERSLRAAKEKAAAERAEKVEQRAFELLKQDKTLSAQAARDEAQREFDGKYKDATLAENSRHNKATEGIGYANAKTAAERAKQAKSDKNEKFDYVIADNQSIPIPKDESKAVFSILYQMMKRDPNIRGDAMESIEIKYGEGGDSDSKMMNTVRRRIGDSPVAMKYLQEHYGMKSPEPETRQTYPPFQVPWGGLNWGNQKENNNETDW